MFSGFVFSLFAVDCSREQVEPQTPLAVQALSKSVGGYTLYKNLKFFSGLVDVDTDKRAFRHSNGPLGCHFLTVRLHLWLRAVYHF